MHQSDISIWPQVNFSQLESSVGLEPHCGAVGCMAEEEKNFSQLSTAYVHTTKISAFFFEINGRIILGTYTYIGTCLFFYDYIMIVFLNNFYIRFFFFQKFNHVLHICAHNPINSLAAIKNASIFMSQMVGIFCRPMD